MSRASRRAIGLLCLALFSVATSESFAADAKAAPRRALLSRGADAVKGLPFFSPNAITALSGAYDLDGALGGAAVVGAVAGDSKASASPNARSIDVWYTKEAVVLGPEWARVDIGYGRAYSLALAGGEVLALRESRYTLFFREGAPLEASVSPDASLGVRSASPNAPSVASQGFVSPRDSALARDLASRAFIPAFARKFLAFFNNAASEAELSFPAFVEY